MKVIHKGVDITEIVTNINWSGDYKQASRILNFNIAVSPTDYFLPTVTLAMEDSVKVLDDKGKEIWQGYVFGKDKSISSSEMSITCYDGLIYLIKSKHNYNFANMTPQAITKKVAGDFNIKLGKLESGSPLDRIFEGETIYNIIMTAYTIESEKSGKLFMPKMIEGKLNVILKGDHVAKFELDAKTNLIDSSYGESMENSINKVKIFDIEGNEKGEVNLSGFSGILQDVYKEEEGVDINTGAKALLKPIEKTASIEALGDFECITGNAVIIKEPFTGLSGLFYIDNDSHTFENDQHMMSLGLSFINIMDSQMSGQDPADIASSDGSQAELVGVGGAQVVGSGKQRVWCFLKSKGFTDQAAAGIMGNLEQESNIDPTKHQYNGGPGRGIMQWTVGSDRFRSLEALARKRNTTWKDLDTQLEFFYSELHNERTGVNKLRSKYGMTPNQLMKLTDASKAMRIFEDCYERAGKPNYPRRDKYTKDFLSRYKGSNCSPNTNSQGSTNAGGKVGDLIAAARTFIGFKYSQKQRFSSNAADCSSLVLRSMAKIGLTTTKQNLTTRNIHSDSRFFEIPRNQARAGDVVWHSGHMALHIGDNTLIEASFSKKIVRYSKPGNRFPKAYRIKGLS